MGVRGQAWRLWAVAHLFSTGGAAAAETAGTTGLGESVHHRSKQVHKEDSDHKGN